MWFLKYFNPLLMAAVAIAGVAVLSRFMGWEDLGLGKLVIFSGSLFTGMYVGQRLMKASARRQRARR